MQRVVLRDLDPASVEYAVGTASYARGLQYVRQRAVVHMRWDSSESALHGTVRGRAGEFYATAAYFSVADGLPLEFERGHCSCPVGFNCKHAAALILAAADTDAAPAASRQSPRSVTWEQPLESLLESRLAVAGRLPERDATGHRADAVRGRPRSAGTRPCGERAVAEAAGSTGAAGQERPLGRRQFELGKT